MRRSSSHRTFQLSASELWRYGPSRNWRTASCVDKLWLRVVAEPPQDGKIEAVYRIESRGVFATLVRLLGDFDPAEEALQDAFLAAVEQWPRDGVPANPRAWLISTGRFKAIDALRRRIRADTSAKELLHYLEDQLSGPADCEDGTLQDD